jgi:hypothetical protein
VAWNGRMWVAGGVADPFIAYSYDGIHWSPATSMGGMTDAQGVAWNGRIWVAVGAGTNEISTSPDGINWAAADTSDGLVNGYAVAWNKPYLGYTNIEQPTIVLGDGSYNTMAYSPDGIRWTGDAGGLGKLMFDGSGSRAAWNGSLWVAVGDPSGTGSPIAYSRDGIAWTDVSNNAGGLTLGRDVAWNGLWWIAVGEGAVRSRDGRNWENISPLGSLVQAYGIAANDTTWLMVGETSDASGIIIFSNSLQGGTWVDAHQWVGGRATSAVWGGQWIVSSTPCDPSAYSLQYASDPAGTWNWVTDTSLNGVSVNDVEWNGDYFVAVGDLSNNGMTIIHSRDGSGNWSDASNNPFHLHAYGITWNDRRWIAVGDVSNNQCIAYSTDVSGHEWHLAIDSSGVFSNAYGVASNSKAGGIVVPSAVSVKSGDIITTAGPAYYDQGLTDDVSLTYILREETT